MASVVYWRASSATAIIVFGLPPGFPLWPGWNLRPKGGPDFLGVPKHRSLLLAICSQGQFTNRAVTFR
jgi:hypothetical protein